MVSQVLDALRLENIKGLRTTIIYGILLIGVHLALLTGHLDQGQYVDVIKWSFGIYAGAKTLYKGTEVWQSKVNAQKS